MIERIGTTAYTALLREAEATPKPGLVDLDNSGAHRDMDIQLFRASAAALAPYFSAFAARGAREAGQPLSTRLPGVRPLGIEAERAMLAATGGVNTHKGAIFTLGVLSYVCGRLTLADPAPSAEALCSAAAALCADLPGELAGGRAGTKGERAYRRYGVSGVRGEAAAGFPHVLNTALPCLRSGAADENLRLLDALMHLIAVMDDTNILTRAGREGADWAKGCARSFLNRYTPARADEYLAALRALDAAFIARNISPGGSADLLAAAWFLDAICAA